jgi:hypothetical protein
MPKEDRSSGPRIAADSQTVSHLAKALQVGASKAADLATKQMTTAHLNKPLSSTSQGSGEKSPPPPAQGDSKK